MNICVINGSPKGAYSITLQTALYLQKKYPQCDFEFLHTGQRIRALEKDMSQALDMIKRADMLLFCYPVYTFIAPYQLHRFIELLKSSDIDLSNKFAAQLSTSKHFYDVTAHGYIKENCLDMGLKYIGGLSADMEDLLSEGGRADAVKFFDYALYSIKNDVYEPARKKETAPLPHYERSLEAAPQKDGFDTLIITNIEVGDEALAAMTADFEAAYPYKTRTVNIAEYPFLGGCLGCLNCASDGKCVYKDGFDSYLRENIQTVDAVVYAFTIKDHSMGASFKRYDDRQFCNGHRTVTMGMPVGYIINGDMKNEPNLDLVIKGRSEVGHNYLAGMASSAEEIAILAKRLSYALENKLVLPQSFLGIGGMKIFRDLIYVMQGFMKADHKFYKQHGIYDFPQKQRGTMLKMKLVGALMSNPSIKKKMGNKMNEGMLAPYKKAIEEG